MVKSSCNYCEMSGDEQFKDGFFDLDLENVPRKRCRKNLKIGEMDKLREQKLRKLSLMNLPQKSAAELSKLIINHQITEVGDVVKTKENCVTIKAKVNLNNAVFRELVDKNVFIKVFTKKNHKFPDEKAAANFSLFVYSKDRNKGQPKHVGYFHYLHTQDVDREQLVVHRVGSVVIMKAFGNGEKLLDVIKNSRERVAEIFTDLVSTIQQMRRNCGEFYASNSSHRNIFFNNNQWEIIDRPRPEVQNSKSLEKSGARNLVAIVHLFQEYGLALKGMRKPCFDIFKK